MNACDSSDYSCASRWFGGLSSSHLRRLAISNGEQITALRFCRAGANLGGVEITINDASSYQIGCGGDGRIWKDLIEFDENEVINEIEIYNDSHFVKGLRFKTNHGNLYEEFGLDGENAENQCIFENGFFQRGDLSIIEWNSGARIKEIRFQFRDCD